jgi:hypothetical protein
VPGIEREKGLVHSICRHLLLLLLINNNNIQEVRTSKRGTRKIQDTVLAWMVIPAWL